MQSIFSRRCAAAWAFANKGETEMMNMRKVKQILDTITGANYLEWHIVAEAIDRQFEMKRNRAQILAEDTEQIEQRIQIEYGNLFEREGLR